MRTVQTDEEVSNAFRNRQVRHRVSGSGFMGSLHSVLRVARDLGVGLLFATWLFSGAVGLRGQGTAFTYQGLVSSGNELANGSYDLRFAIYDASTGGGVVAGPLTNAATELTRGRFTATLDFGSSPFNGQACWLEIGLRTNGTAAFTVLAPRQQLTTSPYAILAGDVATPNVARLNVAGTNSFSGINVFANPNNTFVGIYTGNGAGLTNLALPNSLVLPPQTNDPGQLPINGVVWSRDSPALDGEMASVVAFANWGDTGPDSGNETLLIGCRSIRLEQGWYSAPGQCYLSLGNEDTYGDVFINYTHPWPVGVIPNTTGVSMPLGFRAYGYDSAAQIYWCKPGIQAHAAPITNIADSLMLGPPGNLVTPGELWFYSSAPIGPGVGANTNYDAYPSVLVGRMRTDGWELRGKFVQERVMAPASSGAVGLDFSKGICYDVQAYATNVVLYTTNRDGGLTNYERRVFLIRSGLLAVTFAYPAGWNAVVNQALPAGISPGQMLRLELESIGAGETNVNVVASSVLVDNSGGFDPDAAGFITRASIGDTTIRMAVNQLVKSGKVHGWWGKMDAVYPLVGGTAVSDSQNLVSSNYTIRWFGAVQHTANGVVGDGVSAYGDTGFNAAAVPNSQFGQNSAHLFAYVGSQPSAVFMDLLGAKDAVSRAYPASNEEGWQGGGMNDNDDGMLAVNVAGQWIGAVMMTRTDANTEAIYCGSNSGSRSDRVSAGVPDHNMFLLARGEGNYPTGPTNVNIRGASIGSGMSAAEWQVYAADWGVFETALGRNAP